MPQTTAASAWSPFRIPVFRALWIATLASNIGTWMHDIGAGWLMTSLSPSPVMVALVQTATTLPVFLLALPAGALADIVDRRLHLIATQVFMALTAACLAVMALMGGATPWLLVALTFAMGLGTAMTMPAWVRSRGLAMFMSAFMGSMAMGSLFWGNLAAHYSIEHALTVAGIGAAVGVVITWRWKVGGVETLDLTPSMHWHRGRGIRQYQSP